MLKYFIIFIQILLIASIVCLHASSQPLLRFKRYTIEDGLVQNDINKIYQDHLGFMWFGTRNGLSRFDGIHFKNYTNDPNDSLSVATGWLNSIMQDKHNRLWLITGYNIMIFDYDTETFKDIKIDLGDGKGAQSIGGFRLFCDSKGLIWITGRKIKTVAIDPDNFSIVKKIRSPGIPFRIGEDNDGNIWIAYSDNGLIMYNRETEAIYSYMHNPDDASSISSNRIQTLFINKAGTIWAGTTNGILNKFIPPSQKGGSGYFEKFNPLANKDEISNNNIYSIYEDSKRNLWLGTLSGLFLMNRQSGEFYRYSYDDRDYETVNDNIIRSIFEDKTGNLWVGTRMGIGKVKNQRFHTFRYSSYKKGISANKVQCLYTDKNDNVYIGTPLSADIYNRQTNTFSVFSTVKRDGKNMSGPPLIFRHGSDSGFWIGTWNQGLNFYNIHNKTFTYYYLDNNDPNLRENNQIFEVINEDNEHLWIGTWGGGILLFNKATRNFHQIKHNTKDKKQDELSSNQISCMIKDYKQNLWVGTLHGLNLLKSREPYSFKHYYTFGEDNGQFIQCLYQGKPPYLWVGTETGLYRLNIDTDSTVIFDNEDGLPSKKIFSIQEDNDYNLWISTDNGLVKCNNVYPSQHSEEKFTVEHFSKQDGLQYQFLPRASCKLSDGTLLFGGTDGLSVFHPDSIKINPNAPDIVLTNLRIRNNIVKIGSTINNQIILKRSITQTQKLEFNHKNNAFTLKFAALHYNIPERNGYAFMLKPYDKDWQYTDVHNNEANYMNLPSGDYIFNLKACNSDGVWNKTPLKIAIAILPPWWKTWWFRVLAAVVVISSVLSLYYYRVNALKKQKLVLELKVQERTSELREANSQLEEKQEEILQQNEEIITVNNQLRTKNEEIESQKEELQSSRDQLEKAFNNITLLSEFGQKITATFDLDAINKMIYEYVCSLMDTSAFGIGIYNEKREIIDFPYFIENGKPIPYFYKDLANTKSLSIRCFKNSEEICINDLSKEYQKYLLNLPEVQTSQLPSSVIHLPLIVEQRPIGTITVNSFRKNAYNENDIANLRTLASYISIALDNSKAYRIIRSKNEQISGSIRYGQTIQQAMLPPKKLMDKYFDNFIMFRPKDIVSGDFYWFATVKNLEGLDSDKNNDLNKNPEGFNINRSGNPHGLEKGSYFLAVVDCTGHGVPGAFMSMIGSRLLNDIVIEREIYSPAQILEQLDVMIRKALRQDTTDNNDGMDVCLCRFSINNGQWEVTYAGAKRPLLIYNSENNTVEEIHGTRRSIGGITSRNVSVSFTEETRKIYDNDVFYLSTDGLIDQCNPKKRKFTYKRLIEIIKRIHILSPEEQKTELDKELDQFQENFEQRDDITLVGVKLKLEQ